MTILVITPDVPGAVCVAAGFRNPDLEPVGFVVDVRLSVIDAVQYRALDLDEADRIVAAARKRIKDVFSVFEFLEALEWGCI